MLLNVGKDQKANKNIHNKELCSAGILKIIKRYCLFFEMRQGTKRKVKFKISQPSGAHSPASYGYYFLLSRIYFICFLNVLQLQSNQDKNQLPKLTDKSFI